MISEVNGYKSWIANTENHRLCLKAAHLPFQPEAPELQRISFCSWCFLHHHFEEHKVRSPTQNDDGKSYDHGDPNNMLNDLPGPSST